MRILTAIVTAVAIFAFGASAGAACDDTARDQTAARPDGTAYYPPAESS